MKKIILCRDDKTRVVPDKLAQLYEEMKIAEIQKCFCGRDLDNSGQICSYCSEMGLE